MKAMSKQQLADCAGVSVNTELEQMGLSPNDKVLPPNIVKFLVEKFCIDL